MSAPTITTEKRLDSWVSFLRSHAAITRELSAQLQREHGLTLNDYEVLLHLSHADEGMLRRVDLAERVLLTASGITRLLEGLERAGYVCVRCSRQLRTADGRGSGEAVRRRQDAPARYRRALHGALLRLGACDSRRAALAAADDRLGLQVRRALQLSTL